MKNLRELAIALNDWLVFEQMCKRESLFSESYLVTPIGQFLPTRYGGTLVTEMAHPVLAYFKTGAGSKPCSDFAVLRWDGTVQLAIETKWVSKSSLSPS